MGYGVNILDAQLEKESLQEQRDGLLGKLTPKQIAQRKKGRIASKEVGGAEMMRQNPQMKKLPLEKRQEIMRLERVKRREMHRSSEATNPRKADERYRKSIDRQTKLMR